MKLLLISLGILALWTVSSTAHRKLEWKSIADKEKYLKTINDERREYAKYAKIPNMNKLYWDNFLETKAQVNDWSCEHKTCRTVYRDGNADTVAKDKEHAKSYFGKHNQPEMLENFKNFRMRALDTLVPHQQRVGCAPYHSELPRNKGGNDIYETICFMEPDVNGTSWKLPTDVAGTACAKGFKNDDGLCDPIVKPTQPPTAGGSAAAQTGGGETGAINVTVTSGKSTEGFGFVTYSILIIVFKFL